MRAPYNIGYQYKLNDTTAGIYENPYHLNSYEWNEWNRGFLDAENDYHSTDNWAQGVLA